MMRGALAAALVAAGCGSSDGNAPVLRVQLFVDETTCTDPPELITFPCQGRVGVWLIDDLDQTRDEFCVGMPEGTPLPGLDNVLEANDVAFDDLELGDTVALELAVFSGAGGAQCVRLFGETQPPEPAPQDESVFLSGRSNLVTLEQTTEILVPLSCGFVEEQCDPVFSAFANVTDLETLELQSDPGVVERVQFGFALDGTFVNLGDMAFDSVQYSANFASPPPAQARCVGAVVTTPSSPLDILSCDGTAGAETANILAYTIDPSVVARIDAFSPTADGSVLIGRVVDDKNQPIEGARVSSERGATITYPDLAVDGAVNLPGTGKDGYFIMSGPDSECCQTLTVTDANGGVSGGTSEPTGTVSGMFTATVISAVPGDVVEPDPEPVPGETTTADLEGSRATSQ